MSGICPDDPKDGPERQQRRLIVSVGGSTIHNPQNIVQLVCEQIVCENFDRFDSSKTAENISVLRELKKW